LPDASSKIKEVLSNTKEKIVNGGKVSLIERRHAYN